MSNAYMMDPVVRLDVLTGKGSMMDRDGRLDESTMRGYTMEQVVKSEG